MGVASTSIAQNWASYTEVPLVTAVDPEFFKSLFEGSSKSIVRMVVLGDSQETFPADWGRTYIAHWNALMGKQFGPCSETHLLQQAWWWGLPAWLATTASYDRPDLPAIDIDADEFLPGVSARTMTGPADGLNPFSAVFLPRGQLSVSSELANQEWFVPNEPIVCDVLVGNRADAGTLSWKNAPTLGFIPDIWTPILQQGTLSGVPPSADERMGWLSTPVLDHAPNEQVQILIEGSSDAPVDLIGLRFRAQNISRGVIVHSCAQGGMKLEDFLLEHSRAGANLRALDPSVVVLHYGANDTTQTGIAEWRHSIISVLEWVRLSVGDPLLPVIIVTDPPMKSLVATSAFHFFPAVAADIAALDPRVIAINLRRGAEEAFLWDQSFNPGLADIVHYQSHGQRSLAYAAVGMLFDSIGITMSGCEAGSTWRETFFPYGVSCQVDFPCRELIQSDAQALLRPWTLAGDCTDTDLDGWADLCIQPASADITGDGIVNGSDLAIFVAGWGQSASPADITGDGIVNGADLAIIIGAWGTSG